MRVVGVRLFEGVWSGSVHLPGFEGDLEDLVAPSRPDDLVPEGSFGCILF